MLNFWCNIATGDERKMSFILYKWINVLHDKEDEQEPYYKTDWIVKVEATLDKLQMPSIFNNITKECKNWF